MKSIFELDYRLIEEIEGCSFEKGGLSDWERITDGCPTIQKEYAKLPVLSIGDFVEISFDRYVISDRHLDLDDDIMVYNLVPAVKESPIF